MDYQSIVTIIGSFGFPIFMCLAMGWYIVTIHKELIESINRLNNTMKAVLTKLDLEDDNESEILSICKKK